VLNQIIMRKSLEILPLLQIEAALSL
jgi:hypothetical protein